MQDIIVTAVQMPAEECWRDSDAPKRNVERGPWGGVAVRGPRSVEEYRKIDPRLDQAIQHMNDLPAERVLKAARKALAERV